MKTDKKYRVVIFYPRANQPEFASESEARDFVKARALTRGTACYTELWEMANEDDGEMVALFDYGCREPEELTRKWHPLEL